MVAKSIIAGLLAVLAVFLFGGTASAAKTHDASQLSKAKKSCRC
jgi:hypothetical protein